MPWTRYLVPGTMCCTRRHATLSVGTTTLHGCGCNGPGGATCSSQKSFFGELLLEKCEKSPLPKAHGGCPAEVKKILQGVYDIWGQTLTVTDFVSKS